MPKIRTNLTLDQHIRAHLDKSGNASAYVTSMVEQRQREYAEARAHLDGQLTKAELTAIVDLQNGHWWQPSMGLSLEIAANMQDAGDGTSPNEYAEQRGVTGDRWQDLIRLAQREGTAWALYVVCREVWGGGPVEL